MGKPQPGRGRVMMAIGMLVLLIAGLGAWKSWPWARQQWVYRQVRKQVYIRVAPNGRYFQFEDGRPFVVVGHNDAMTWPYLTDLYGRLRPEVTEEYFQRLQAHGVNTIRIMAEYAQFDLSYLQDPVGTFIPETVQFWDDFFALAEKYGIYVILTPWDTFWMNRNWDRNPWNAENGGPVEMQRDWLADPEVIAAQKRTWQFIIDRWGDSPNILAWELMNEIEMWWGNSEEEILAWVDEMSHFVRTYERERWGKNHLITVSLARAEPWDKLAELVYSHPGIDFANTHLYYEPVVNNPRNTVDPALAVNHGVRYALEQTARAPRPYLDTESGPIGRWPLPLDFDAEYYHNMSWAHLASGGAGQGLRWPYTQPHTMPKGFLEIQAALSRFVAAGPWLEFTDPRNIDNQIIEEPKTLIAMGVGDGQRAVIWAVQKYEYTPQGPPTIAGGRLTVTGMADGAYHVSLWDTWEGRETSSAELQATGGELVIPLPAVNRDVALMVRPVG